MSTESTNNTAAASQPTCSRGHQLTGANLIRTGDPTAPPRCRACSQAWSQIQRTKQPRSRMQARSDKLYAQLMASPPPQVDRCPRGHLLQMPNLSRSDWERRGRRACLSCNRAHSWLRHQPEPKTEQAVQRVADAYYAELDMTETS